MSLRLSRRVFVGTAGILAVGGGCLADGNASQSGRECERAHQDFPDLLIRNEASKNWTLRFTVYKRNVVSGEQSVFFDEEYALSEAEQKRVPIAFANDFSEEEFDVSKSGFFAVGRTEGQTPSEANITSTVRLNHFHYGTIVTIHEGGVVQIRQQHSDPGGEESTPCKLRTDTES